MKARYVVDTNVLIAASAAAALHNINATPTDPELRKHVWQWLDDFRASSSRMILDSAGKIYDEYQNKLGFNDFGRQVVIHKWSTVAVDQVSVHYDEDGYGILQPPLDAVVHDNDDKKMVAAALDALRLHHESCIAFAGDTDWHDWEAALQQAGLLLEPLIEEWSRAKHAEKAAR